MYKTPCMEESDIRTKSYNTNVQIWGEHIGAANNYPEELEIKEETVEL